MPVKESAALSAHNGFLHSGAAFQTHGRDLALRRAAPGLLAAAAFEKRIKKIFYEKIPWFLLTVFSSIVTIVAQDKNAAVKSLTDFPIADRLANAAISYGVYLKQSFWPSGLTVFYPYPYHLSLFSVIAAGLALAGISFIVIKFRHERPYLLWGWLFYLGVLFPVIGIIQVGGQAHADRYMLLPQIGIILAVGLFLDKQLTDAKSRKMAGSTMIIIGATLMILTFRQFPTGKQHNPFNHNLETAGENELAHFNLGSAYLTANEPETAIIHYSAAAQMNPQDATTYNNMGLAFLKQKERGFCRGLFPAGHSS